MNEDKSAALNMLLIFLISNLLALLIVPLYGEEYKAFQGQEENPLIAVYYMCLMLVITGIVLYLSRKNMDKLIQDDNFYNVGNIELYSLLSLYIKQAKNLNLQLDSYSESFLNDKRT